MANYIGNQPSKGEFRKIDQFVFDGSTTVFNLISNTIPFIVGSATQLTISINGVLQEPGVAYTVVNGGTQISFTTAPVTGTPFFGTALSGLGDEATPGDGTVTSDKIVDNSITNTKMADDSVGTTELVDNAITSNKIIDNAVTSNKIVDNSITNSKMADGSVGSIELIDNAVTSNKISNNSITNSKIADDAIGSAEIADNIILSGDSVIIPSGTTGQRPITPSDGMMRFNSTTTVMEFYDGGGWVPIDTPPTVTSLDVTEVDSTLGGSQTFIISGTGFKVGAIVSFIGNSGSSFTADTTTRDSSIQITAIKTRAAFLNASEPYDVKVTNTTGSTSILENQINIDSTPIWVTASGSLGEFALGTNLSVTLLVTDAESDPISFTLLSGTLPAGTTLNTSTGIISGTTTGSASVYSFTIRATANNKTTDRSFTITTAVSNYFGDGSDGSLST
jgi:hypothetical protein